MKLNLKLAQRLFLCITPLVAGSLVATLPSFAATLASSEGNTIYSNFSHNPLSVGTGRSPNTLDSTNNGQVVIKSETEATFNIESSSPSTTRAFSRSASTVEGNSNSDYAETANSSTSLFGYQFQVGAGETFSFNFNGFLNLNTSVDSEPEAANAFGLIAFQLFDSNDMENPISFLSITGSLNSLDNSDFLDVFRGSDITLNPNGTSYTTNFGGNKETANTQFTGQFSRFFNRATTLVMREFKSNSAGASCPSR
ncbi:MAG: hypothetical protein Fur006_36000 [Coleofasciculaceae cyanobacterium]